jgi:hypothetical protein
VELTVPDSIDTEDEHRFVPIDPFAETALAIATRTHDELRALDDDFTEEWTS